MINNTGFFLFEQMLFNLFTYLINFTFLFNIFKLLIYNHNKFMYIIVNLLPNITGSPNFIQIDCLLYLVIIFIILI